MTDDMRSAQQSTGGRPPSRSPARPSMAGGFLVAVGAMGGTAVGLSQGAAVPGFLAGLGAGVVMAIIIWLIDRRR